VAKSTQRQDDDDTADERLVTVEKRIAGATAAPAKVRVRASRRLRLASPVVRPGGH